MKICIFGAASNLIDDKYIKRSEELCYKIAKNGHELVFGAGANGLMGAAARSFTRAGSKITGVIPHFFKTDTVEPIYDKCDELIFTDTMRERKKIMEDMADAFVVLPGGIGTLEELFEIITLKQLAQHKKPIAFFNIYDYYDKLMGFMDHCEHEKFIREGCHNLYLATDDDEKLIDYIEDDTPFTLGLKDLK
ncbi:MAG: TIGR00730 family Rossman fold protein [Clostridia bacterium]|nr:TIGR00730 family Rossman fold protein [Clostridia bacterium]